MNKLLYVFAVTLAMLFAQPTIAKDLRLLSSWGDEYAYNPYLRDAFTKGVEERTDGRLSVAVFGPETVSPFEQLEPVASGVFDFLFTSGSYHSGTTPIMTIVEAISVTPKELHDSGLFDHLDQHYQAQGLKLITAPVTPNGAYHYIMKNPMKDNGSWDGSKVRGVLTHKAVIEMLGGNLVVLPPAEVYTSLEKGVVDGAVWPAVGIYENKWHEVAKYLLRPRMGTNYMAIFMNLDAWNSLSKEDQAQLMELGREIEDAWYEKVPSLWQEEEDLLVSTGVELSYMGEKQQGLLDSAWADGLWSLGMDTNAVATKELKDFATSNGLIGSN